MAQMERVLQIKQWLDAGQCLTRTQLETRLNVSWATLKRDFSYLRQHKNAPLVFDRERAGWRLDAAAQPPGTSYAVDLSLREDEVHALLAMQELLAGVQPGGLLTTQLAPLRRHLSKLLTQGMQVPMEQVRRIRVLALGARRLELPHFQAAAHAVLRRRRLRIVYRARSHGRVEERDISPQRLVHYRENWHLDAWCHRYDGLRTFSLDAVEQAQVLEDAALELSAADLDEELGRGYGIFAGSNVQTARLRFTPERARWVSAERWHPDQRGRFAPDGHWLLDVPYADSRELVMDILRHVPEVEVLWPEELAQEVRRRLAEGLRRMGGAG